MSKIDKTYAVVIPVYNSSNTLFQLISRIKKTLSKVTTKYEIILVDDASTDNSWNILEKLKKGDARIKIIQLIHNYGQHTAVLCGFSYTKADYTITIDDDLQNPPEEIIKFIEYANNHPEIDAIIGVPKQKHHSFIRIIGSQIADWFLYLSVRKPCNIRMSSFRMISKSLREALLNYNSRNVIIGSLICLTTNRMANVIVEHKKRMYGNSTYSYFSLIRMATSIILNHSQLPLRWISTIGIISSIFAALYTIIIIYQRLNNIIHQAGFASIVILISFYSGLILFSFGIIGEYLIRILNNSSYDRTYMIRQKRI